MAIILTQLLAVSEQMPRNSKGFKKKLRGMTVKELKRLYKESDRVQELLWKVQGPIEDALLHRQGFIHTR